MPVLEFSALDDYVVLHRSEDAAPWLAQGYTPVEPNFIGFHAAFAVGKVDRQQLDRLLFELTLEPVPGHADAFDLERCLAEALSPVWFVMLSRPIKRPGSPYEIPKLPEPSGPPRLDTEHYVVVEAVDEDDKPVRGVQLELVIAGGEVKRAATDKDGVARVERIQAGRVVIRVLGLDGNMWSALEGEPAQPSAQEAGFRWHAVQPGECLSRIAHRYGIKGWRTLWEHARNEPLRKKRKSPHVLLPGDQVAVPREQVHEIIRTTDATHRIEVSVLLMELSMVLSDHHGRPYTSQTYELRYTRDAREPSTRGTTDAKGQLRAQVPAHVARVFVSLPALDLTWPIAFSSVPELPDSVPDILDERGLPNEEATRAVQLRLNALGVASGSVTGVWDQRTQLAVLQLRRAHGSESDDPLCDQDLDALKTYGV